MMPTLTIHALGKMSPGKMLLLQDIAFGALCNVLATAVFLIVWIVVTHLYPQNECRQP